MQIAALLVRPEKGDGDFAAGAKMALQAFADFSQGEVAARMRSWF
jgi:hypothetical protein